MSYTDNILDIERKFKSIENFISFYDDLAQLQMEENEEGIVVGTLLPYSTNGWETSIVVAVGTNENGLYFEMITNGLHCVFKVDNVMAENFYRVQRDLLNSNVDYYTKDEINSFEFIIRKPFLYKSQKGIITKIKPLDLNDYNKYLDIYEKYVLNI